MKFFKENVQKQFDERQRQVKETIQNLKEGFEETRKDDGDICSRKLQRLEKQKNKGNLSVIDICLSAHSFKMI